MNFIHQSDGRIAEFRWNSICVCQSHFEEAPCDLGVEGVQFDQTLCEFADIEFGFLLPEPYQPVVSCGHDQRPQVRRNFLDAREIDEDRMVAYRAEPRI